MAENKKSFILYADYLPVVSKLTDAKAGKLFKLILEYVNDKNPAIDDILLQIAFEPIRQQLKRDLKRWERKKTKLSEAGKRGGIKSGQSRQNEARLRVASKNEAIEAVNVNVNANVNVINKGELSELEIGKTVEFCSITLRRIYDKGRVRELWKAFLIQNEDELYNKRSGQIKHFRNWIKTQPYEPDKPKENEPSQTFNLKTI